MLCVNCDSTVKPAFTTDVTNSGNCLVIIRNVPCSKCPKCGKIIYTLDVKKQLDKLISTAENLPLEISIIDYQKVVCAPTENI